MAKHVNYFQNSDITFFLVLWLFFLFDTFIFCMKLIWSNSQQSKSSQITFNFIIISERVVDFNRNGEQLVNISTNGRKRLSLAKVRGRQDNGVYSCNAALSSSKLTRNDPIEGGDRPLCDGYQKSRLSAPYVLNVPG